MENALVTIPSEEERFLISSIGLGKLVREIILECNARGNPSISVELVDICLGLMSRLDKTFLIRGFINRSYPHWKKIAEKGRDFFIDNCEVIFFGVPVESLKAFRGLFVTDPSGKCAVPQEDIELLWENILPLVKISIKFVHKNSRDYPHIDCEGSAKLFGITLPSSTQG